MRKGDYRLIDFFYLPEKNLELLDLQLYGFIKNTALKNTPTSFFNQCSFLGAGWEWSVFKKNKGNVIKIPAGVFSEVNSIIYLENTIEAYKLFCRHFSSDYIATSIFFRENGLNIIEQEYVEGAQEFVLTGSKQNLDLLKHMQRITLGLIDFLHEQETIPDIGYEKVNDGFRFFRNILLDQHGCPKLIDFTAYYDPFRIYPPKKDKKIKSVTKKMSDLLYWISSELDKIENRQ